MTMLKLVLGQTTALTKVEKKKYPKIKVGDVIKGWRVVEILKTYDRP